MNICGSLKMAGLFLALLVMVAIVAAFNPGPVFGGKEKEPADISAKSITAESMTIKNHKSKGSVSIVATDRGPGVWLTAPNGDYTCITALDDGQHAIYLMRKSDNFGNIALTMGKEGIGQIQFRDSKGQCQFLSLEDVIKK